jgi:hypothetical protein
MTRESSHARSSRGLLFAAAIIAMWYGLVYLVTRPLTEAPVGDSWVYEHAVTHFNRTGEIQFAGFTQAMPVAQVLYGVVWSRVFGAASQSLDLSTALLGLLGGLLFYALSRKCGAGARLSAVATALLICNPCYLFLSFSFMTEVPFLVALLASYLAFAYATNSLRQRWLWLAGAAAAVGFAIRPFAAATIAAEAAALLVAGKDQNGSKRSSKIAAMRPLLAALLACALFWIWLTILRHKPWMLRYHEYLLRTYFMQMPVRFYLARGVLEPAIYLGIVLSPLALLHAIGQWRRSIIITLLIVSGSIILVRFGDDPVWNLTRFGCFGGSYGALVLNGAPSHDVSAKLAWILLILGAVGFSGICNAGWQAIQNSNPVVLAVLLAAAAYWIAIPLLWFFSDRYDVVLVPPACLLLALVPLRARPAAATVAGVMTTALAMISVGGMVSYHRSMQRVVMQTEALLRQGIPRQQIDAGYSLNGRDLYVYPAEGTLRELEPPIPLIVGSTILPYVISTSPIPNTVVWQKFSGCGPLGFGSRPLFVLREKVRSSSLHPAP